MLIPILIILLIIYFSINTIFGFQYINYMSIKKEYLGTTQIMIGFLGMFFFGIIFWLYVKIFD